MLRALVRWNRHWTPLGTPISLHPAGFLLDPNGVFQTASESLKTISELWELPFVVLCGEPASGKSTVIELHNESLKEDPDKARQLLMIDFRTVLDAADFRDQFDRSNVWQAWQSSDYVLDVVIDGVDEGVLKIGEFLSRLILVLKQLRHAVRTRLCLKLVCRTLDWTPFEEFECEIAALLRRNRAETNETESNERPVYTLCPLTRDAVAQAILESNLDLEGFFSAVGETRVTELAAYPFTLKMLLSEFAKGSIVSSTRRSLYEGFARGLCNQSYERLRTALPAGNAYLIPRSDRLLSAVELFAAVMIVTGRDTVQLNSDENTPETCLRLEDLLRVAESISVPVGVKFSEPELRLALGTAIFTDRGAGRFGFIHRTMAECLAARRFAQMELRRLRPLFFQGGPTDRHVIPQIAQTASWLCEDHPEFFSAVLQSDVEVLLRSEVSNISNEHKERIVDLLLERARSGKLGFDPPLYLAGLKNPNISQQISRALLDKDSTDTERALAVSIAEECEVHELSATLFELLESEKTPAFMLARIADALVAIHKAQPKVLLALLLPQILSRDIDFRVRGKALDILVPDTLSVVERF
jgi:hypothetical protein